MIDLFFYFLIYTSHFRGELQDVWTLILLFACFRWGGGPEKASIAIWAAITGASTVALALYTGPSPYDSPKPSGDDYWSVEPIGLAADGLLLVGFFAVALFANRRYVLWLAAFQVIALSAHLLRAMIPEMTPFTYVFMTVAPGWAQVFIITYGLVQHVKREPRRYADWRWQVSSA